MLLSTLMGAANAASVSLLYTGGNIDDNGFIQASIGDLLAFDLVMDFADRITLGGGFDLIWDSSVFAFESYVSAGLGDNVSDDTEHDQHHAERHLG